MATVTLFQGFKAVGNKSLLLLTKDIKEGKYKQEIERIRTLVHEGKDKDVINQLKRQLPSFTPSATFNEVRSLEYIDRYSGFLVLDLDHLNEGALEDAFEKA